MNFTKEHKASLIALIGRIVLLGESHNGGRLGSAITVEQAVNLTKQQLNTEIVAIDKELTTLTGVSKWESQDETKNNHQRKLERWRNLFDLILGHQINKENEAKLRAEKRRLATEIEALEYDVQTPKEKLKKKKEEYAALSEVD